MRVERLRGVPILGARICPTLGLLWLLLIHSKHIGEYDSAEYRSWNVFMRGQIRGELRIVRKYIQLCVRAVVGKWRAGAPKSRHVVSLRLWLLRTPSYSLLERISLNIPLRCFPLVAGRCETRDERSRDLAEEHKRELVPGGISKRVSTTFSSTTKNKMGQLTFVTKPATSRPSRDLDRVAGNWITTIFSVWQKRTSSAITGWNQNGRQEIKFSRYHLSPGISSPQGFRESRNDELLVPAALRR